MCFDTMSNKLLQIGSGGWQAILRKNFNRFEELADYLELGEEQRGELDYSSSFQIQVPLRLAEKMPKKTLDDPITRQFLPLADERRQDPNFFVDPVCDKDFRKGKKLLHKYQGRVLLVCTGACAMHCRYCFRQNFDYSRSKGFDEELAAIEGDRSIHEVILSGGDPLSLSNSTLSVLLARLSRIPHLKRIRFHSRFPIGIPERIDDSFLNLLSHIPQQVYFIVHCNHPRELDRDVLFSLKALQQAGCLVLNQAVLLKHVNDDVDTLQELAEQLSNHGILFYYLHQLDRVQGALHFEVDEKKGRSLVDEIAKRLPGYAVPKYVREIAGEPYKTPLL